jgi:hypothetical protein
MDHQLIYCGMTEKRLEMAAVSVMKKEALFVKTQSTNNKGADNGTD